MKMNILKTLRIWLTQKRGKNEFHGGKHYPAHKAMSTKYPSREALLVPLYYINLIGRDRQEHLLQVQLGDYVQKGQLLTLPASAAEVAQHAPTSGVITAIDFHPNVHPSGQKTPHLILTADGFDTPIEPLPSLNYRATTREELLKRISDCGISGLGGAAFPMARKLKSQVTTLVVNAAECEPYITCDDLQIQEHTAQIISGAQIAAFICGAERIAIGIEDDKPQAIAALKSLLPPDIEMTVIPAKYPSGNARQLFELLFDVRIPPNAHANEYGFICHNTGTLKALHDAVILGQPLIERYTTVSGEGIRNPAVLRARIGTPLQALIQQCGGAESNHRCVIGGPMMGFEQEQLSAGLQKMVNAILVLPAEPTAEEEPCVRCAQCATACPMELLPQQLYWYSRSEEQKRLQEYRLFDCIECGLCASVCPSSIPLVQYFRHSKAEIKAETAKQRATENARERHEAKKVRLERDALERAERQAARTAALKSNQIEKPVVYRQPEKPSANSHAPQIEAAPSFNPTLSNENSMSADLIAAAKARSEARKAARLSQHKSVDEVAETPTTNIKNEAQAEDKLAAAKAKAAERRAKRLQKESTEASVNTDSSDVENEAQTEDKLAAAKAKAAERRAKRLNKEANYE